MAERPPAGETGDRKKGKDDEPDPRAEKNGNGRKTARWTYLPVPEDARTLTALTFEHGRLVEVERKVVK